MNAKIRDQHYEHNNKRNVEQSDYGDYQTTGPIVSREGKYNTQGLLFGIPDAKTPNHIALPNSPRFLPDHFMHPFDSYTLFIVLPIPSPPRQYHLLAPASLQTSPPTFRDSPSPSDSQTQ